MVSRVWCKMTFTMTKPHEQSPVLGTEIKRLREEAGLSQQVFATNAGIGMTTLIRAEKSEPGVSYRNIAKIAKVLGVHPSAIYNDAPIDTDGGTAAPGSAQHQFEQLQAALAEVQKTLKRIEAQQRDILRSAGTK
jgi:transcriptional regulator with XRE-family HTH domain